MMIECNQCLVNNGKIGDFVVQNTGELFLKYPFLGFIKCRDFIWRVIKHFFRKIPRKK